MARFTIQPTSLPGLLQLQRQRIGDARGFLARLFCTEELAAGGWPGPVAQINHTLTERRGTVRGMHFQRPPHAEYKLVSCLRGSICDVAVDLRRGSPTFGRWHAATLSAENGLALLIPAGFAHGFQALEDGVELLYCHSAAYAAAAEGGLHPQDPTLAIAWPLPITELSVRDAGHASLDTQFKGLEGLTR